MASSSQRKLRRNWDNTQTNSLRAICVGTLFVTNTLTVDQIPHPNTSPVVRASVVSESRGGSAASVASVLAQFHNFLGSASVESALVASLADNDHGRLLLDNLTKEGVITRFSKIWPGYTVPSAWVIQTQNTDSNRTIINHNSLPDLSHDDFISLLGPVLAPENFGYFPPSSPQVTLNASPNPSCPPTPSSIQKSGTYNASPYFPLYANTNNPAPFDWLHFEGRSVKTTLMNIQGVQSLASEKHWRSNCVFSVDLGRKYRQGMEALIPHADVIFVNKHYAEVVSPSYSGSPRAFLLSLTSIAPRHALLVADWGKEGAGVLSVPTRDYFQSSAWVETEGNHHQQQYSESRPDETLSVRSDNDFWGDGRDTPSSSGNVETDDDDLSSQYTELQPQIPEIIDEVGAADAFIAGMIYALSRSVLPGSPYTPFSTAEDVERMGNVSKLGGKWRLEECLRFATEVSGRKARKAEWSGLADEMVQSGWTN